MCGFAGIINSKTQFHCNDILNFASKVSFRGPDHTNVRIFRNDFAIPVEEGRHCFFFNRLKIIDLSNNANQPFENERYLLLFNGEIYNYQELRKELVAAGYQFTTTSDTEVLFNTLLHWGEDGLMKLNGMFAIFWLDKVENKFIIARDRIGIKPLYYSTDGNTFTFGSELDSIVRLKNRPVDINQKAANHYLWLQFVPTPYTIIDGINKLPPGYKLKGDILGNDIIKVSHLCAYWELYDNLYIKKYKPSHNELEKLLTESLERQLHCDVPIGLFLSSGVDSSLLASLINKSFSDGQKYEFFSVAFKEATDSDESEDAFGYLSKFHNNNLSHTKLYVDSKSILGHLENLYNYYDEPFGDSASLLNWVISKAAREYVTVALSGDGADELFWGYSRYIHWSKLHKHALIKNHFGKILINSLNNYLPFRSFKLNKLSKFASNNLVGTHFSLFLNPGLHQLSQIDEDKTLWSLNHVEKAFERGDFVSIIDMKTYLADAMLYKVDRSSMAASLEVRVPFLDNTVIDYSLSLPLEEKSTEIFPTKSPLKQLLIKTAPHYKNLNSKKGFNFPLSLWMKTQWRDFISDTINSADLSDFGLDINTTSLFKNFFNKGDEKLHNAVWYIFNLALWQNTFKQKHKVL